MAATDVLKHEHKIVLLIMEAAARDARSIKETGKMDPAKLDKILDFCKVFIDRCHHGKEEEYLFPKLQERGMAGDQGPIAVMLREHEEGRRRLKAIAAVMPRARSGDAQARAQVADNLEAYAALLQAHIDKENHVLFPLADQLFTPSDQQDLVEAFKKHEAQEIGEGVHEKYHRLAHELTEG